MNEERITEILKVLSSHVPFSTIQFSDSDLTFM